MVQNAKKHGQVKDGRKDGFFIIENENEIIKSVCCNHASETTILSERINDLNNCELDELTKKSKDSLLNFDENGGLGLIQMAMFSHPSPLISKTILGPNKEKFMYIETIFKT